MSSINFSIIALPKLERELDFIQLRERYAPTLIQLDPHIRITQPWVPAELGEVMMAIEFVSQLRKKLSPLAFSAENWQAAGELIIGPITQGTTELLAIREKITGAEPLSLLKPDIDNALSLILFRVPVDQERARAVAEANRIGRTLGVVDSLILIRTLPDGTWHRVARFPFGVGRVDFYEPLIL